MSRHSWMDEVDHGWQPVGHLATRIAKLQRNQGRRLMKIGAAFPSKYLKASDLNDKAFVLTMDKVTIEEVGQKKDQRPILYFLKTDKGLVLNKTNANVITKLYGEDTDNWEGHQIELYPTMVEFGGEQVEAIRMRAPKKNAGAASKPQEPPPHTDHDIDDEIPF